MPRFKVPVTRNITETAYVEVECAHIDAAAELACDAARGEPSDYRFVIDDESAQNSDYYFASGDPNDIEVVPEPEPCHECDNCGLVWTQDQLVAIEHVGQRVSPGEPMPSGECYSCGALCHPTDKQQPEFEATLTYNQCGTLKFTLRAADEDSATDIVTTMIDEGTLPDDGDEKPTDGGYDIDEIVPVTEGGAS